VVFTHANEPRHFFTMVKQHGALLAKGRLTGIQFDELFTDNLYFRIARHAIDMAQRLKQILADSGFKFYLDSPTNQQFVIMPNDRIPALQKQVEFSVWGPMCDQESVCRFVTSWATTDDEMLQLEKILLDNK
jgi:threonine aldolase